MKGAHGLLRRLWVAALAPLLFALNGHTAQAITVHVDVNGLRSDHGQVWCFLYNSATGFPRDQNKSVKRTVSAVHGSNSSCDFSDVPDGTYAISVYHDENGNGKLDSNFLGIPREGVGASNDATGRMGPPRFEDAMFRIEGISRSLTIHINYL